jgi:hypothetical protein
MNAKETVEMKNIPEVHATKKRSSMLNLLRLKRISSKSQVNGMEENEEKFSKRNSLPKIFSRTFCKYPKAPTAENESGTGMSSERKSSTLLRLLNPLKKEQKTMKNDEIESAGARQRATLMRSFVVPWMSRKSSVGNMNNKLTDDCDLKVHELMSSRVDENSIEQASFEVKLDTIAPPKEIDEEIGALM